MAADQVYMLSRQLDIWICSYTTDQPREFKKFRNYQHTDSLQSHKGECLTMGLYN